MSKVIIGRIGAPHGVRGEVRIIPLTDFPDRFQNLKSVFIDEQIKLEINNVKYNKQFIILKFKGIDNRSDIDPLKGKLIQVDRKDVPPLAAGEYYNFDIIGLEVYNEKNERLGKIEQILKTGSNDVYIANNAGKQTLIPALKKVVTNIDIEAGRMDIILQEEME
ncbi:MAG: Ribosome maturation factor rimM [Massilibacillus sp.]|jgi:16S rRNA processing protein RimM|nr:Ribosome maturation factor rimM [Massilibacillus sp.]